MQINGTVNEWETVAVPLTQGVDLNTRARLVEPTKLLDAKNCFFPRNGGPEKRKGYTADTVTYGPPFGPTPEEWVYGFGFREDENVDNDDTLYEVAGELRGVGKRDDTVVVWDGHKLYQEINVDEPLQAYLPTAVTTPIAKSAVSHAYSDAADNGVIRVVAYRDLLAGDVKINVYNSSDGSLKTTTSISASDPEFLYVVPCGRYVHVFVQDITDNVIYHLPINQGALAVGEIETLGIDVGVHFDVVPLSATLMLLAYIDTSSVVRIIYLNSNGSINNNISIPNTELVTSGDVLRIAVTRHPFTNEIGLIWGNGSDEQRCRVYDADGAVRSSILTFADDTNNAKVAITTDYSVASDDLGDPAFGKFYAYSDSVDPTNRFVRARSFIMTDSGMGEGGGQGTTSDITVRYNVNLVSHAFRVGNVPFVFVCYPSDFQTTYLLMDKDLKPVGKLEYGTAVNNTADPWTFSVSGTLADYTANCGLMYKQRVLDQDGVFHEVGTKFCELNFLPEFRRTQAGRSLYFPGAQLWEYDGKALVEAGFHFTPEDPVLDGVVTVGASLTVLGSYQYRIYPCYKNAQGEEVRGPAILTDEVTLAGAENSVDITINSFPTRREDSYFLVYRNVNAGTVWYLVSDRNPASDDCPKNNQSAVSVSFVDTLSDADALQRELDPANSVGYLHSFSAPACEVIAYGKDRLWLAGGELTKGTILPSRLFFENETPGFHGNLAYSIDRDASPITAIGFLSDFLLAFKEDRGYIVTGDPADNVSQGDSLRNQLALSDVGCVSHNSLGRLTAGLVFQSEGGIRLVGPSGNVTNIGSDVDSAVSYVTDCVIDTENRLVKFFQEAADSLVFDYESGQWTTWTIRTPSAIANKLVKNSKLWTQSDEYTDDSAIYSHSFRCANIGPTLGGVNRFRRVGGIGETDDNYSITVKTYLDDSDNFSEVWEWDSSEDLETSTWGSGTWGSGFWGGSSTSTLYPKDNLWRWRHRCVKQKASCISVEVIYSGSGKGPVHTALLFEIGRKQGLDRQMKGS